MIDLYSMLSFRAWEGLARRRNWMDVQPYLTVKDAAALWFRLRAWPDSDDDFPHGKSASLQRLEELIVAQVDADEREHDRPNK